VEKRRQTGIHVDTEAGRSARPASRLRADSQPSQQAALALSPPRCRHNLLRRGASAGQLLRAELKPGLITNGLCTERRATTSSPPAREHPAVSWPALEKVARKKVPPALEPSVRRDVPEPAGRGHGQQQQLSSCDVLLHCLGLWHR